MRIPSNHCPRTLGRYTLPFVVLEPDYVSVPTRTWTLPQLPQAGSILLVEVAALSTENQFFLGQLLEQRARRRSRGDAQPRLFACAAQPVDVQATTGDLSTQLFYRLNALHLRLGTTLP